MSHLNIKLLKHLYYNLNYNDVMEILRKNINENMNEFNFNKFVELPRVIINPDDVFYFEEKSNIANFFCNKSIEGEVLFLKKAIFTILIVKLCV